MRVSLFILFLINCFVLRAQKADELLVYHVKGKVLVIENQKESVVKIGRMLKQGCTLKTSPGAVLTMVCKQGKALKLDKEGNFPLTNWKDSCKIDNGSLTSRYFKYVWSEFYVGGPRRVKMDEGGAAFRMEVNADVDIGIQPWHMFDTVNFAGAPGMLAWEEFDFKGQHIFNVYRASDDKLVYRDSSGRTSVKLSDFVKLLQPGTSYYWSIMLKDSISGSPKLLNYFSSASADLFIQSLGKLSEFPEDMAGRYFRIAYLLEQNHWIPEAWHYYQKAIKADPSVKFYRDELEEFRRRYKW